MKEFLAVIINMGIINLPKTEYNYKIGHNLTKIVSKFSQHYFPSKHISIDETMIRFEGWFGETYTH